MLDIKQQSTANTIVTVNNPKTPANETDWANARLIASAPELLEALERLVGVCKVQRDVVEQGKYATAWNPPIEQAEKAIAKAKGD